MSRGGSTELTRGGSATIGAATLAFAANVSDTWCRSARVEGSGGAVTSGDGGGCFGVCDGVEAGSWIAPLFAAVPAASVVTAPLSAATLPLVTLLMAPSLDVGAPLLV